MAIQCIHCGTELPDTAQFCLSCGKPPGGEAAAAAATQASASPPDTYAAYLDAPTIKSDGPSASDPLIPPPPPLASYLSAESPSVPGSAGAPAAPPSARQKSRRGLWIALVVIAVVLVVGGGLAYYLVIQSTPTKTLQTACDALKSGDYQTIYNLFTTNEQRQVGPESQYAAATQQSNSSKGGVVSCTVSGVTEQDSSASGMVTVRFGDGSTETDTIQLADENGTWKISGATTGS
jgi:hypothetical protein